MLLHRALGLQVAELRQQCSDEAARATAAVTSLQHLREIHGISAPLLPGDAPLLQECATQPGDAQTGATQRDADEQQAQQEVVKLRQQNAAVQAERDRAQEELGELWAQLQQLKQVCSATTRSHLYHDLCHCFASTIHWKVAMQLSDNHSVATQSGAGHAAPLARRLTLCATCAVWRRSRTDLQREYSKAGCGHR